MVIPTSTSLTSKPVACVASIKSRLGCCTRRS
uniref:Uncharacterized protein n=1 Tax=virus sp. ctML55 TaxID=2827627 RepID=A0A8S5RI28_9VIRU|nr:MAG TPA: hypothetical protein [virus sp. ctML55]DAH11982.1 MAG TPA: hypothetical protein [Caudoviricetes sp.]